MSLIQLAKYLGRPALKGLDLAGRKLSLPILGADLYGAGSSTVQAVRAAKEGDAVKATGEGLLGYGSTIFAPQALDYARKNNPKILKALDVVTPKRFKTGINIAKQAIEKFPLAESARKKPIRTGLALFGGGAALEPTRDLLFPEASAAVQDTTETKENLLTPIKTEQNQNTTIQQEPDSVQAESSDNQVTNLNQKNFNLDETINNLSQEELSPQENKAEDTAFDFETNKVRDENNINADGEVLLQGNGSLNMSPIPEVKGSVVPKEIKEMADALEKTLIESLPDGESATTAFMIQNAKLQNRILEQKFSLLQKRKDLLRTQGDDLLDFEEFYDKFNKMAGKEVPDASKDFILLKFGLNLMTGRTDQEGLSGFLDVAGRAGIVAVNELQELYQLEKDKREAMALKYLDYENTMKNHLNTEEIALLNAQSNFLDSYTNAKNQTLESLLKYKNEYYKALAEKQNLEQQAYEKKYTVENSRRARFDNPNALYGISYTRIADSKGPGGTMMFQYQDINGELRYGTKADMAEALQLRVNQILNSNKTAEVKKKLIDQIPTYLINLQPETLSGQDIKEFSVDTYKKNISRTKTLLEAIENIKNTRKIASEALSKGVTVLGFKGKFNEMLSTFGSLFNDVTNADIEKQIALLDQDVLPNDKVMFGGLSQIQEFELENGEILQGAEAQRRILELYGKELEDAESPVSRQFIDKVKKQLGEDKVNSLSSDQQQQLFTAIRIAEVQLKYALANSFKGEDRLTEKNLQEFGNLTRFIGGIQPVASVTQKLRQLELLALQRLNYETRIMKFAGASDADLRLNLGDKPFRILFENYQRENDLFQEEGISDVTLDQLQSITKGITE